jgi:hypothetical protein
LSRPAERVVSFYNQRSTAEQWIKEGKKAVKWARLSCCRLGNNEVRLQLFALTYYLMNFMRTLALPKKVEHWSLTTLRERLVKIFAKIVAHGRNITFQMAEVAVPRDLFRKSYCGSISCDHQTKRRPEHGIDQYDGGTNVSGGNEIEPFGMVSGGSAANAVPDGVELPFMVPAGSRFGYRRGWIYGSSGECRNNLFIAHG